MALQQYMSVFLLMSVLTLLSLSLILPYVQQRDAAILRTLRSQTGRLLGSGIAFHAGSRWLRHPELSEPWAAYQDGPSMMDTDPAGAWSNPVRSAQSHTVATQARLIQHGPRR